MANQILLIKGGKYLEKLAAVDSTVFDKRGTLMEGRPEVTDIIPNDDDEDNNETYSISDVLQVAKKPSSHQIAKKSRLRGHSRLGSS